jgi:hypothetical protein
MIVWFTLYYDMLNAQFTADKPLYKRYQIWKLEQKINHFYDVMAAFVTLILHIPNFQ